MQPVQLTQVRESGSSVNQVSPGTGTIKVWYRLVDSKGTFNGGVACVEMSSDSDIRQLLVKLSVILKLNFTVSQLAYVNVYAPKGRLKSREVLLTPALSGDELTLNKVLKYDDTDEKKQHPYPLIVQLPIVFQEGNNMNIEQQMQAESQMEVDQQSSVNQVSPNTGTIEVWYYLVDSMGTFDGDISCVKVSSDFEIWQFLAKLKGKRNNVEVDQINVYAPNQDLSDVNQITPHLLGSLGLAPVTKRSKILNVVKFNPSQVGTIYPLIVQLPIVFQEGNNMTIDSIGGGGSSVGSSIPVQQSIVTDDLHLYDKLNVVIKDNGSSVHVPLNNLRTMSTLYEFARSHFPDRNIVLYEEHLLQNMPCFIRVLVPPRHDATLVIKEKQVSPHVERRFPVKQEPKLKSDSGFRELYEIVHSSVSNKLLDEMARVTFVPASQFLGNIAKIGAPQIPVTYVAQNFEANFIFHQGNVETEEMKKLKNLIDMNCSSLIQLVGVSGCGKTTTVFGIGMRQRMIYCAGRPKSYSSIEAIFRRDPHVSTFINAFRSWVLTRHLLIVYLEQEYDFDFVDLMAAQNSDSFELIHKDLLAKYWQRTRDNALDYSYLMDSYPSLISIDECHTILMRQAWTDKVDKEGNLMVTYGTLWSTLITGNLKLVLILLTTHLFDFVQDRITSSSNKFQGRRERFVLFHDFTYHEVPSFMNLFVDVPDNVNAWLAGRARIGTHMLQLIIENASQFTEDNYQDLFQTLFQQFFDFNVNNVTKETGCLCDFNISLKQNIVKHSRGRDSSVLRENLLLLVDNTITGNRRLDVEEIRLFVRNGIGFLETVPHKPSEFYVSLREPLMTFIVLQTIGFDHICDHFVRQLDVNRHFYGETETSKGILFQYAVTTALATEYIQKQSIGQLLESWTGKSREELIRIAPWIGPLLDQQLNISLIQPLRKNAQFTGVLYPGIIYILSDHARSEIILLVKGSDGNVIVLTLGVKMIRQVREKSFAENCSAATFLNLFLRHDGTQNTNAVEQRFLVEQMIPGIVGNIAIVVTLPTNFPNDHDTVSYSFDEERQFGTLYVYIDEKNLHCLMGEARTETIMTYYRTLQE